MRYLVVFAALMLVLSFAPKALAYDAVTAQPMNVRAGPSGIYPLIGRIAGRMPVNVHGCLDGWKWCDISTAHFRGWVAGNYLLTPFHDGEVTVLDYGAQMNLPVVTFTERDYWGNYYSDRDFYRARYGFWHRSSDNNWNWQREDGRFVNDNWDDDGQPWYGPDEQ